MPAAPRLYPDYFRAQPEKQTGKHTRRTVEVPERASPHVKLFFCELRRQHVRYDDVEAVAGVRRATQKSWKHKSFPSLTNLQAAFSYLGWDYVPVPALESLPGDISAELVKLARQIEVDVPAVWRAAVAVGVEQALLNMSIAEKRAVLEARAANDNTPRKRSTKTA